jgi:hypothetical protein
LNDICIFSFLLLEGPAPRNLHNDANVNPMIIKVP